jgi:4-hydroxybenzoate polyprenyltransferase/phosphoserine phosphatase
MSRVTISHLPLCVDLDGTLCTVDTLHEAAIAVAVADWRALCSFPCWLSRGKAHLKQQIAMRWKFDAASLPYTPEVICLLRQEREQERLIVLCTAADKRVADAVAQHLDLFDEVIASNGEVNLSGKAKADALVRRFGVGAFTYLGNDMADLAVWDKAGSAILVNASKRVRRAANQRFYIEKNISIQKRSELALLARALRPHQWSKNLLCLIPLLASGSLEPQAWLAGVETLVAFCATASAIYVLNDMSDLAADRAHPRKVRRPFASGDLPVARGLLLAPALLLLGTAFGWLSGVMPVLFAYAGLSMAYTLRLKELPLVDVFVLAALYTLRVVAGGEAAARFVSLWLLGFSGFLFLSLALIKRTSELQRLHLANKTHAARRGYVVEDLQFLQQIGCASTFASAVVLSLYVQSEAASRIYQFPEALWFAVPLLLFWQCRLWLATSRGYMHDDPIVYASSDLASWVTLAGLFVIAVVARFSYFGLTL